MKDSTVSVRVEAAIKKEAESILQQLGIPVSVAINALYRQIILRRGLPFPIEDPRRPKALEEMSKEEFDEKLMKGYNQALAGEGIPLAEAFKELRKGLE